MHLELAENVKNNQIVNYKQISIYLPSSNVYNSM